MNVPSFTDSNIAIFFLYTKSLTAGRGTASMETEGWMTYSLSFFWTLTFVHRVNTFLQPNGTFARSSLTSSPVNSSHELRLYAMLLCSGRLRKIRTNDTDGDKTFVVCVRFGSHCRLRSGLLMMFYAQLDLWLGFHQVHQFASTAWRCHHAAFSQYIVTNHCDYFLKPHILSSGTEKLWEQDSWFIFDESKHRVEKWRISKWRNAG